MAINALYCTSPIEESVYFSGQSIPVGSFITAVDGTPAPDNVNYCFEITAGDEPTSVFTATTETYSSCYDCLVNNFAVVTLDACDMTVTCVLPISAFGYIPIIDQVIYAEIEVPARGVFTTYTKCFKVIEVLQVSETSYVDDYEPDFSNINQIIFSNFSVENGCNECLYGFTAGTEYSSCIICCPCDSGSTATTATVPHPQATNVFGQTVVQFDAVQLGGSNGLYA